MRRALPPARGLRQLERSQKAKAVIQDALQKKHPFGCICAACEDERKAEAARFASRNRKR